MPLNFFHTSIATRLLKAFDVKEKEGRLSSPLIEACIKNVLMLLEFMRQQHPTRRPILAEALRNLGLSAPLEKLHGYAELQTNPSSEINKKIQELALGLKRVDRAKIPASSPCETPRGASALTLDESNESDQAFLADAKAQFLTALQKQILIEIAKDEELPKEVAQCFRLGKYGELTEFPTLREDLTTIIHLYSIRHQAFSAPRLLRIETDPSVSRDILRGLTENIAHMFSTYLTRFSCTEEKIIRCSMNIEKAQERRQQCSAQLQQLSTKLSSPLHDLDLEEIALLENTPEIRLALARLTGWDVSTKQKILALEESTNTKRKKLASGLAALLAKIKKEYLQYESSQREDELIAWENEYFENHPEDQMIVLEESQRPHYTSYLHYQEVDGRLHEYDLMLDSLEKLKRLHIPEYALKKRREQYRTEINTQQEEIDSLQEKISSLEKQLDIAKTELEAIQNSSYYPQILLLNIFTALSTFYHKMLPKIYFFLHGTLLESGSFKVLREACEARLSMNDPFSPLFLSLQKPPIVKQKKVRSNKIKKDALTADVDDDTEFKGTLSHVLQNIIQDIITAIHLLEQRTTSDSQHIQHEIEILKTIFESLQAFHSALIQEINSPTTTHEHKLVIAYKIKENRALPSPQSLRGQPSTPRSPQSSHIPTSPKPATMPAPMTPRTPAPSSVGSAPISLPTLPTRPSQDPSPSALPQSALFSPGSSPHSWRAGYLGELGVTVTAGSSSSSSRSSSPSTLYASSSQSTIPEDSPDRASKPTTLVTTTSATAAAAAAAMCIPLAHHK